MQIMQQQIQQALSEISQTRQTLSMITS